MQGAGATVCAFEWGADPRRQARGMNARIGSLSRISLTARDLREDETELAERRGARSVAVGVEHGAPHRRHVGAKFYCLAAYSLTPVLSSPLSANGDEPLPSRRC